MTRLILTFDTMFHVLAADKLLRQHVNCRPTPTPAHLSVSICGVALELLDFNQEQYALELLKKEALHPQGVHRLS